MKRRVTLARFLSVIAGVLLVSNTVAAEPAANAISSAPVTFARESFGGASLGTLASGVFDLALNAASCAVRTGQVSNPKTLTVIDYSRPSSQPRLWVVDLTTRELLYEELVAHGQGSGGPTATMFSNEPETHRTSLGLFVTDDTYVGKNGYSLRLNGLDMGINDKARERAIVMHGAPYVSESMAKKVGRIGRSWGCPAVSPQVAKKLIDTLKDGSPIFAYYPDPEWLQAAQLHNAEGSGGATFDRELASP